MPPFRPGDLCIYRDDHDTPRILLSRVLIYLYSRPEYPDEGVFLCSDGTVDEEFFIFLKNM